MKVSSRLLFPTLDVEVVEEPCIRTCQEEVGFRFSCAFAHGLSSTSGWILRRFKVGDGVVVTTRRIRHMDREAVGQEMAEGDRVKVWNCVEV